MGIRSHYEIPEEAIKSLNKYKYSAIDLSPIANYILQPYWRWATTLFPLWMAPNLITLLGFFFILFNLLLCMWYSPDLYTAGPPWIYFSFAFGVWMYSTFDNVDGKQARRTGSSSALGEVFDHGIDSLNCSFGAILQAGSVGHGFGYASTFIVVIAATNFYFSTWETYHTGTLYLGYINGPTEGLLLAIVSMIISGIYGPHFWCTKVSTHIDLPAYLNDLTYAGGFIIAMTATLITTQIPVSIYRALSANYRKGKSSLECLSQLIPYFILLTAFFGWIFATDGIAMDTGYVILLIFAVAVGRICAAIIVNHVTHQKFPSFWYINVPLCLGFLASKLQLFP